MNRRLSSELDAGLQSRIDGLHGERDIHRLMESIVVLAQGVTGAQGGALYRMSPDRSALTIEVARNDVLGIALADSGAIGLPAAPLSSANGVANDRNIAVYCAVHGESVNLADCYRADGFDLSGMREFDASMGYHSKSMLSVPLLAIGGEVVGVLQVFNRTDSRTGKTVAFSESDRIALEALSFRAANAMRLLGGILEHEANHERQLQDVYRRLEQLNEVGAALSSERSIDRLLEHIVIAAKTITHADGGTLYRIAEDGAHLCFEIVHNDTLKISLGGTTGNPIHFGPLPLRKADGKENNENVAAYCAINRKTLSFADAYEAEGFNFSGTRKFDADNDYRSKSFLSVPMINHENEVIGVLQLINRMDPERLDEGRFEDRVVPFSDSDRRLAESLASQAAIALTNRQLIQQLEGLFESFIDLMNRAIDDKSPYTGGHCQRVPELTMLLAEAVNDTRVGPLAGFRMTEKDRYELKIAGLLHDCGKVTTPVHVVDKATKLQTIWDRMELIDTRIELIKRDAEISALKAKLALRPSAPPESDGAIDEEMASFVRAIEDDREFLRRSNVGSERMSDADQARIRNIAGRYRWHTADGHSAPLLMCYRRELEGQNATVPLYADGDIQLLREQVEAHRRYIIDHPMQTRPVDLKVDIYDEVENLTIAAGTLTAWERHTINYHISATIKMLDALPWPGHLANVPEYAGGHHERMDGKGYPKGLTREQMSVQARVMGIADIFEALTAKDRPYKPGKTLSESLHILGKFRLNGHIDPDLFDVFVRQRVYLDYARVFLDPTQIDEVDEAKIPGYVP